LKNLVVDGIEGGKVVVDIKPKESKLVILKVVDNFTGYSYRCRMRFNL